jgi:hypothetical protein
MGALRYLFASILVLLVLTPEVRAQPSLEKLRLAYSAIGDSQASVWIPYVWRKGVTH